MTVLIIGGSGFVGLNLAEALLAAGRDVVVFDRGAVPQPAAAVFAALPGRLTQVAGDVRNADEVAAAMPSGLDGLVLGAAVTADAARDGRDPETILAVNLAAVVPVLRRAREAGVRRIVNLSSAAAYGAISARAESLREDESCEPESLYAITKFASERVLARLGALWGLDVVSVRLSAVFGPWERATGARDTLSPQAQILAHADAGRDAILPRPGLRDWIYGPDVAAALLHVLDAPSLRHRMYNVSTSARWSALAWGERLAPAFGTRCRLAGPGEAPNVDLHAPFDRAPLDTSRLAAEFGWEAGFGLADSVADLLARRDRDALR